MLTRREENAIEVLPIGAIHGIASEGNALDVMAEEYLNKLSTCAPRSGKAWVE
jgi:hypothetical protein